MPLLKGTLDALALKALSFGSMHAFEIIRWIEDGSRGEIEVETAALLQALHRMEERSHLSGEWGITDNNRRARFYKITPAGRAFLRSETESLRASVTALSGLLARDRA
ncbi:MAG: helix-turn-helix transcriptional regulator [Gemmatimonadaceae bacterium]